VHSVRRIFEFTKRTPFLVKMTFALMSLHLGLVVFVVSKPIYYDSGGIFGLLWWLGALWVLPFFALLVLLTAALKHWLQQRSNRED
jgi:hypothetical protein